MALNWLFPNRLNISEAQTMNEQQIRLKLSRLPGDKLIRVATIIQGIAEGINTKEDAVNVLTDRIITDRQPLTGCWRRSTRFR
jgi:hypothetical protein